MSKKRKGAYVPALGRIEGKPNPKNRVHRRKLKLFREQNGCCMYCKVPMLLRFKAFPDGTPSPEYLATLEHLDHRLSGNRGVGGGTIPRTGLACYKCNTEKGAADLKYYSEQVYIQGDNMSLSGGQNVTPNVTKCPP